MKREYRIKHADLIVMTTTAAEKEITKRLEENGFGMNVPILRYTDFQTTEEVFQQRKELEIKSSDDVLNLTDMFKKQAELDSLLLDKFNMTHEQAIPFIIRALKSEFGEAQAKWGGFKYWSTKQKYERDEIVEELADMLHFYLSIGNYLKVPLEHTYTDWTQNSLGQMDAMDYSLSRVDEPLGWYISFAVFRGLVHDWGFDWENDLIRMYRVKNKINHKRQENGY